MSSILSLHLLNSNSFSPQAYINSLFESSSTPQVNIQQSTKHSNQNSHTSTQIAYHSLDESLSQLIDPNVALLQHQSLLHENLADTSIRMQDLQKSSLDRQLLDTMYQRVEDLIQGLNNLSLYNERDDKETDATIGGIRSTIKLNRPQSSLKRKNDTKFPPHRLTNIKGQENHEISTSVHSFEKLQEWFSIRQKLEYCCKILKTAQVISEGIETLKSIESHNLMDDSGALKRISNSVIMVQKAFEVLKKDGYDKHFQFQQEGLVRYVKRIEDFMRERFIEILRKRERWIARGDSTEKISSILEVSKEEVRMSKNIRILDQVFRQYVERECKESLLRKWNNVNLKGSQKPKDSSELLSKKLPLLYNSILSYIHRDAQFLLSVFEETDFTPLSVLIIEVLSPVTSQIQTLLKHGPFPDAIVCYDISLQFSKQVSGILQMYSKQGTSQLQKEQDTIHQYVMLPYQQLKANYAALERNYFRGYFESTLPIFKYSSIDPESLETFITHIKNSSQVLFLGLKESATRCLKLSNGIEFPSLIQVANNEVRRFTAKTAALMNGFQNAYLNPGSRSKIPYSNRLLIQQMLHFYQICKSWVSQGIEFAREMQRIILSHETEIIEFCSKSQVENTAISKLFKEIGSDELVPFKELIDRIQSLHKQAISCTQGVLTLPIKESLRNVHLLSVWGSNSSTEGYTHHFSPMEYIQQIYQHLVELPGDLQLLDTTEEDDEMESPNWLEMVCSDTVHLLKDTIVQISHLSHDGRKQLESDLNHFTPLLQILIQNTDPTITEIVLLVQCINPEEFASKKRKCQFLSHEYIRKLKKILGY